MNPEGFTLRLSYAGLAFRRRRPSSHRDRGRLAEAAQHQVPRGTWLLRGRALCGGTRPVRGVAGGGLAASLSPNWQRAAAIVPERAGVDIYIPSVLHPVFGVWGSEA